jgi:hypothetical protein
MDIDKKHTHILPVKCSHTGLFSFPPLSYSCNILHPYTLKTPLHNVFIFTFLFLLLTVILMNSREEKYVLYLSDIGHL